MKGQQLSEFQFAAVVTAAGSSTRMGGAKKEYRTLNNDQSAPITVLGASLRAFISTALVDVVVLVVPPQGEEVARAAIPADYLTSSARPPIYFTEGGSSRRSSVHNGLKYLESLGSVDYVLIHDAARPWISADLVSRLKSAVCEVKAVIPVMPLVETPKELDSSGYICRHLPRSRTVSAQTPQAFAFAGILAAHEKATLSETTDREFTDDAEVWGTFIGPVKTIPGLAENKKITFPEDLPNVGKN